MKKQIFKALTILNDKGYQSYLVGGGVRNYLLNKQISDYDITTDADPNAIKMAFSDYPKYDIGKELGTVVVVIDKVKIDITPFRKEDLYIDHRRPSEIVFTSSLKEDLKRRDFTINAMCLDKDNNLIDLFNGLQDLNKKTIRAIGNPNTRFHEDGLRILRALRFKAKLNFSIEEKTNKAIYDNKDLLKYISNERKREELLQLLETRSAFKVINEYLDVFNTFMSFKHIERKINNFNNSIYALAYLLTNSDITNLKELKYSKEEINLINYLISISPIDINDDYEFITSLSNIYQKDALKYLSALHHKDLSKRYSSLKKYMVDDNELKIDGNTIQEFGYSGKEIKAIKNKMLDEIHHKNLENKSSKLLAYLKNVKM